LIAWNQGIEKAVSSALENDLFSLMPSLIGYLERDVNNEELASELDRIEVYMVQSGDSIIRALSYHIVHEQGVVAAELLRQAVRLLATSLTRRPGMWMIRCLWIRRVFLS
jgi:hypothetical protein